MSFRPGRARMNMQLAEIPSEPLVGFHIHRLIAEEQHLVLRQRLMQFLDLAVAERVRQRDAVDLRANAGCHRRDGRWTHSAWRDLSMMKTRLIPPAGGSPVVYIQWRSTWKGRRDRSKATVHMTTKSVYDSVGEFRSVANCTAACEPVPSGSYSSAPVALL